LCLSPHLRSNLVKTDDVLNKLISLALRAVQQSTSICSIANLPTKRFRRHWMVRLQCKYFTATANFTISILALGFPLFHKSDRSLSGAMQKAPYCRQTSTVEYMRRVRQWGVRKIGALNTTHEGF